MSTHWTLRHLSLNAYGEFPSLTQLSFNTCGEFPISHCRFTYTITH
jgi:hypothetical protein